MISYLAHYSETKRKYALRKWTNYVLLSRLAANTALFKWKIQQSYSKFQGTMKTRLGQLGGTSTVSSKMNQLYNQQLA